MKTSFKVRLNKAFRFMRMEHLLAEHNVACCISCASKEMIAKTRKRKARGCVFYHAQDAEMMQRCNKVYLAFWCPRPGAFPRFTETDLGRTIVRCCRDAGLKAEWDGKACTRILVAP